jgi:hypothetical protein
MHSLPNIRSISLIGVGYPGQIWLTKQRQRHLVMVAAGHRIETLIREIKLAVNRRHDGAAVTQYKAVAQACGLFHGSLLYPNLLLHQWGLLILRRHATMLLDKLTQIFWYHHRTDLLR